jgi:hypothetical protein
MHDLRTWSLRIAIVSIATGGIVAACHDNVPGPAMPRPTREASPIGPRPQPIQPSPIRFESSGDAGVPLPTATPGPAFIDDRGSRRQQLRVADDEDAGIGDSGEPGYPDPNEPGDDDGDTNEDWIPEPIPDAGVSDVLVLPPVPEVPPEVIPDAGGFPK